MNQRGTTDAAWVRWACRAGVGAFLIALATWGWRAGMDVRERAWTASRTIRYNLDVHNSVRWGNAVLRTAQAIADDPDADTAHVSPTPRPDLPRPTFFQVVRGEGRVYDDRVDAVPTGEFQLDYPPLRLLTMALWTRGFQDRYPTAVDWPGGGNRRASGWLGRLTNRPAPGRPTEDIAAPLLAMNAYSAAATAVLAFGLVWLWTDRGGRRPGGLRRTTRLRAANGLVLFPVAAAAFAYAAAVAVLPVAAPPPAVAVTAPPVATGDTTATVTGTVDPQGADARWHAEWGTAAGFYDHAGDDQEARSAAGLAPVAADLTGLPAGATVHYRLVARNDSGDRDYGRGITHTDDATLIVKAGVVQPAGPGGTAGAVWLDGWQWVGLGLLFLVTCGAMRALPAEHRGWAAGLMAAIFIWFDPALIVDGHVWPQWDGWVLPPFLAAALLASLDGWLLAGVALGIGAMFKGQVLLGSPVLLVWPLVSLRWGAAGRLVVGFALAAGLIVSPWIVLNDAPPSWGSPPLVWIAGVAVATGLAVALSLYRRPARQVVADVWAKRTAPPWVPGVARRAWERRPAASSNGVNLDPAPEPPLAASRVEAVGVWGRVRTTLDPRSRKRPQTQGRTTSPLAVGLFAAAVVATTVVAAALVLARWPATATLPRSAGVAAVVALLVVPWVVRRKSLVTWSAIVAAAAVWAASGLFPSSWGWMRVGFEYGTHKFDHLSISRGETGNNLGTLLADQYGWNTHDPMLTLHLPDVAGRLYAGRAAAPRWLHAASLDGVPLTLDVRQTMLVLYAALVLACGAAAAMQARRRDPRFLAAVIAPWMLMPNLLAQMMNRYQIWGAVLTSMLIGLSPGLGLLHVLVSLIAAGMIGLQLLAFDPARSPQVQRVMTGLVPSEAGLMLAASLVVLCVGLIPGRRDGDAVRRPWRRRPQLVPARAAEPPVELHEFRAAEPALPVA